MNILSFFRRPSVIIVLCAAAGLISAFLWQKTEQYSKEEILAGLVACTAKNACLIPVVEEVGEDTGLLIRAVNFVTQSHEEAKLLLLEEGLMLLVKSEGYKILYMDNAMSGELDSLLLADSSGTTVAFTHGDKDFPDDQKRYQSLLQEIGEKIVPKKFLGG